MKINYIYERDHKRERDPLISLFIYFIRTIYNLQDEINQLHITLKVNNS